MPEVVANYAENKDFIGLNNIYESLLTGHNAKLRSLHLFMDETPHNIAVRVWSQPFSINEITTYKGKVFKLINLPFYYVSSVSEILRMASC